MESYRIYIYTYKKYGIVIKFVKYCNTSVFFLKFYQKFKQFHIFCALSMISVKFFPVLQRAKSCPRFKSPNKSGLLAIR